MRHRNLFILWGALFLLTAALGFVNVTTGVGRWLLTAVSLLFFLPPAVLIYRSAQSRDRATLRWIRNLSLLSLGLTLALLLGNVLSALGSGFWGGVLHVLLVLVSAPMIASGYWALSLFLWACLLFASIKYK